MKKPPELVMYVGPMWSGKTMALLSYVDKCKYQKKKVIAFKPGIDNRYSADEIASHSGWKVTAHTVETGADIVKVLADSDEVYDVIAIDELFMIKGAADFLIWAFRSGITVVVSTLDLSATCSTFPEVRKLLPWATKVVKCSAACSVCTADARYTYRKPDFENSKEISVGGENEYEPRCFQHHPHVGEKAEEPG